MESVILRLGRLPKLTHTIRYSALFLDSVKGSGGRPNRPYSAFLVSMY